MSHEPIAFGASLRRHRVAAGLSLGDLAQRIHYSKSYLSKIETGRKLPSLDLARRCDAVLGTEGALASLLPAVQTDPLPLPAGPFDDQWVLRLDGAGRGGFGAVAQPNTAAPGTIATLTWAMPPDAGTRRDGSNELSSLRLIFDEMRRLGQATAPATLLPVLIAQTHAMRLFAAECAPPARAKALLLASRFAEFTGWIAQETGDDRAALWWTDRAVEFAAAGGDPELAAFALVRRGLVAMYRYDARETVSVSMRAQRAQCSPRIRGLAALREAQGHALAGSYDQCRVALDRAEVLLQAATDDGQPTLGTTTVQDPVAMVTGWCLHDLGRPRQALGFLEGQLAALPDRANRALARIGVRYSLALVGAGELEHACMMFDRLLDSIVLVDSATIRVDLRRLAQEFNRRHAHRAVREVMPRLVSALHTSP